MRQRRQLAHDAIICATELGDLASAFDALQDAKASLLGDLRRRLSASPLLDSDAIQLAHPRLNQWLRDGESPESAGDPGDDAPLAAYLRACRLARPPDPVEADQPIPSAQDFLESVQRALPPDWALLDFWVLSEAQTWVFVVRPDRPVEFVDINSFISNAALLAVNQFHHRLRSPYAPKTYLPVPDLLPPWEFADDLFEEVFAPLLPYLEGVKGLYLVPHKFWHLVPLHAAWRYDPATKEVVFLSDEFAIAYLSSASLLPQLPRPDPGALIRDVLSLANPARGTPRTLPFADWEAEYLRARLQLPAGRFYAGPDATWDRTADWGGCTLVHFACHGLGDTKFAPLSRLELRDDFLLAHDVVHRRPALSEGAVVILNGCQTAVRDLREVDEGMGLMTAFLLRGAGLVLGTLWNVPDDCAAEMVTTFVTELVLQEKSPTEALQQAQRHARQLRRAHLEQRSGELRSRFAGEPRSAEGEHLDRLIELVASRTLSDHPEQDADPENDHPYDDPAFWAAFVLVGRVA